MDRTRPGARTGGSQGIVFTEPPSWSTAIRSRGRPPLAAARCNAAVIARSWAEVAKLKRWTSTPPMSPRLARASSDADGVVPVIETTSFWPTSCSSVGSPAGRARSALPASRPAQSRQIRVARMFRKHS